MASDSELATMMLDLESDRVDRKAAMADTDRIRQAICAFANDLPDHDAPGFVLVGVNDDGTCAHLSITDELLLRLASMRDDGQILPFPMLTVQKRRVNDCEIAVVEVQPSRTPPVRYNGRVWVRVGPRRAQATQEEEQRLTERRRAGNLPFDRSPAPEARLEDLELDIFRRMYLPAAVAAEVLAQNERTLEQQLASLHFLTREGVPNIAAVLVFGKDPTRFVPGAYIQFVRIDGAELTDPIRHQKEIAGPLPELLLRLDELLDANISVATNVRTASVEIQQPDYPIVALQQLSRNAVLHRTYESSHAPTRIYWFSDRIEIHSPGGLFGQVTADNFGQPGKTDYRNPLLAEAMKVLGFVQRFGLGIPLARRELERNSNPPLELAPEANAVLVTIRRRS